MVHIPDCYSTTVGVPPEKMLSEMISKDTAGRNLFIQQWGEITDSLTQVSGSQGLGRAETAVALKRQHDACEMTAQAKGACHFQQMIFTFSDSSFRSSVPS